MMSLRAAASALALPFTFAVLTPALANPPREESMWVHEIDGSGKSHSLGQFAPSHAPTVILDPAGEASSYRQATDYPIYRTLESALDRTTSGGTILVAASHVPLGDGEPLSITKPITIRSLSGSDAYAFESATGSCAIIAADVTIEGATWRGANGTAFDQACLRVESGRLVLNNVIFDWDARGPAIWLRNGAALLSHVKIASSGPALRVESGDVEIASSELRSQSLYYPRDFTLALSNANFAPPRSWDEASVLQIDGGSLKLQDSLVVGGFAALQATASATTRIEVSGGRLEGKGYGVALIGSGNARDFSAKFEKTQIVGRTFAAALVDRVANAEFAEVKLTAGGRAGFQAISADATLKGSEVIGGHFGIIVDNAGDDLVRIQDSYLHGQTVAIFYLRNAKARLDRNHVELGRATCKIVSGSERDVAFKGNDCGDVLPPHDDPGRFLSDARDRTARIQ